MFDINIFLKCYAYFKDLILPVVMSLFLAYIAFQQWRTNQSKLKLDLYNKRFEIYSNTLKFYQELISEELTPETHKSFIESKEASKFLFSSDRTIYKLLDEMHEKSFKITGFKKHSKELASDNKVFLKSHDTMQNSLAWFNKHMPILSDKMRNFLDL